MAAQVHLNDIGTHFELTLIDQDKAVVDLGPATTKQIFFMKPSGARVVQTAVFHGAGDGSDGVMEYIAVSGDIDQIGDWKIQGYVVFPTGEWYSAIGEFEVFANI